MINIIRNNISKLVTLKNIMVLLLCFILLQCVFCTNYSYSQNMTLTQTKQKIDNLKKLEKKEMNKLNKNQIKLENAEKELMYSKSKYSNVESQLKDLSKEYEIAQAQYNQVSVTAKNRIRQIYKNHTTSLISMLMSSSDINDLLDKIYYQNLISKKDKADFEKARDYAKNVSKIKYDMEVKKEALKRSISDINSQQKTIQKAISENERYIQKLKTDRATFEKAEKELAKNSSNIENMISRTSKNEETITASGSFLRPISGPITSPYGTRIHPIFKSRSFHSGIDIGGPNNGAIKAANNGKVIYVGWYGGYGKVVILDHGKYNGSPTTTLYAHLNSYSVSVGQYVVKGQVIGREGATGYATGPHLHFEVRINGQPRNPANYI